jgi:hypothetical protein
MVHFRLPFIVGTLFVVITVAAANDAIPLASLVDDAFPTNTDAGDLGIGASLMKVDGINDDEEIDEDPMDESESERLLHSRGSPGLEKLKELIKKAMRDFRCKFRHGGDCPTSPRRLRGGVEQDFKEIKNSVKKRLIRVHREYRRRVTFPPATPSPYSPSALSPSSPLTPSRVVDAMYKNATSANLSIFPKFNVTATKWWKAGKNTTWWWPVFTKPVSSSLAPAPPTSAPVARVDQDVPDDQSGCPVPDLTSVRCAHSAPVVCYRTSKGYTLARGTPTSLPAVNAIVQKCYYDVACYASVAGFNFEKECEYLA